MAGVGGGAAGGEKQGGGGNNQGGFHRRSINRIAARASLLQTFSSVHDEFQTLQGKLLLDGGGGGLGRLPVGSNSVALRQLHQ